MTQLKLVPENGRWFTADTVFDNELLKKAKVIDHRHQYFPQQYELLVAQARVCEKQFKPGDTIYLAMFFDHSYESPSLSIVFRNHSKEMVEHFINQSIDMDVDNFFNSVHTVNNLIKKFTKSKEQLHYSFELVAQLFRHSRYIIRATVTG